MKKLTVLLLLVILFGALCVSAASAENLDTYFKATFNKSPKFYTGPGKNYLRAGNGKAQYGGGGEARVFGYEGSWLLLGYQTGAGNYRIGYFEKSYLANMTVKSTYSLRQLNFEYRSATITATCDITDDPVLKYEAFGRLQSGTQCKYLASYDNQWAYIEVTVNSKPARGFVPIGYVSKGSSGGYNPPSGPSYPVQGVWASLRERLSTRSGPGTRFDEPGTFFLYDWQYASVRVLGKAWDSVNEIWWVLVDFSENGTRYRAWTGHKRVNVDINSVPYVYSIGEGTISATYTWRGPGANYALGPVITHWQDVVAYGRENGYVEVEWYNAEDDKIYRFWVPEDKAQISFHN